MTRTIIIGNSGSGKTWLARRLAAMDAGPVIHLDHIFWEPGGFDKKRPPETVDAMIAEAKGGDSWIAEGVFGELAARFMDRADRTIWLDIEWPICKERLLKRGSESKAHMEREESEEGLRKLVEWASQYHTRTDWRSHEGHRKLLEQFRGTRVRLKTETEVKAFLERSQPTSAGDVATRAAPEKSRWVCQGRTQCSSSVVGKSRESPPRLFAPTETGS